jgi:hypothetical protein
MKNNCREIQLTDYIDATEPELNYPLQIIGNIPFNAIQNIKTTLNFINATPAQMWLLKEIDFFWYRMMYWISYYRIGNLDRRLPPLSLKEFRNVEIFGQLYAAQLDLTIHFYRTSGYLPARFKTPFEWWTYQMLEIKQDMYFSVFHPLNNTKTQAISDFNKCLQFMEGKDYDVQSLETKSSLTQDFIVRSRMFAQGRAKKNQEFKSYYVQYLNIYKKIYISMSKEDTHYISQQKSPTEING